MKHRAKRLAHKRRLLIGGEHFAGMEVDQTCRENRKGSERTHHNRVCKHFKDAPHSLPHRLYHVGRRVHHHRGPKSGFV